MTAPQRRRSVFQETGLDGPEEEVVSTPPSKERPQGVRFRSRDEVHLFERYQHVDVDTESHASARNKPDNELPTPLRSNNESPLPSAKSSIMYRLGTMMLLLAAIVPFLQSTGFFGHSASIPIQGVDGVAIPDGARREIDLSKRDNSPTDACFRWAQQCKQSRIAPHLRRLTTSQLLS